MYFILWKNQNVVFSGDARAIRLHTSLSPGGSRLHEPLPLPLNDLFCFSQNKRRGRGGHTCSSSCPCLRKQFGSAFFEIEILGMVFESQNKIRKLSSFSFENGNSKPAFLVFRKMHRKPYLEKLRFWFLADILDFHFGFPLWNSECMLLKRANSGSCDFHFKKSFVDIKMNPRSETEGPWFAPRYSNSNCNVKEHITDTHVYTSQTHVS